MPQHDILVYAFMIMMYEIYSLYRDLWCQEVARKALGIAGTLLGVGTLQVSSAIAIDKVAMATP